MRRLVVAAGTQTDTGKGWAAAKSQRANGWKPQIAGAMSHAGAEAGTREVRARLQRAASGGVPESDVTVTYYSHP